MPPTLPGRFPSSNTLAFRLCKTYLVVTYLLVGVLLNACTVTSEMPTPTPTPLPHTPISQVIAPSPSPTAATRPPTVQPPTSTPAVAITCQPSIGLGRGYIPARGDEEREFAVQVRGAEAALRDDPNAYKRYCLVASRVSGTFVCKQNLPKDVAARANTEVYSRLGEKQARLSVNCAIEVSHQAAFVEAKSAGQQQRLLAAILSHESTHLAQVLDIDWDWVVRFDKAWLDKSVKDGLGGYQASELADASRQLQSQRASQYAEIEREAAAGRSEAMSRLQADVDKQRQDILRRNPNLTRQEKAGLEQLLAEAIAEGQAEIEANVASYVATSKTRVEQALAEAMREAEAEVAGHIREIQRKDRDADYLKTFEESIGRRALSPQERNDVIRGECWAQHEERYTSTTIGGTSLDHTLDLILFLSSPQCLEYLNLR